MTSLFLILTFSVSLNCPVNNWGSGAILLNDASHNSMSAVGYIPPKGSCSCVPMLKFTWNEAEAQKALADNAWVWQFNARTWAPEPVHGLLRKSETLYHVEKNSEPVAP